MESSISHRRTIHTDYLDQWDEKTLTEEMFASVKERRLGAK